MMLMGYTLYRIRPRIGATGMAYLDVHIINRHPFLLTHKQANDEKFLFHTAALFVLYHWPITTQCSMYRGHTLPD